MQIIKLAGKGPKTIRVTIDYLTGKTDARVVDNVTGEGCHGSENDQLLRDLLEAEVPGFDGKFNIEDSGLTEIGYRERNKGRTKPLPVSPIKETPGIPPGKKTPGKKVPDQWARVDTGFNV